MKSKKVGTAKRIMDQESYLELDDQQEYSLLYSTRRYGNMMKDEAGAEDIAHVRKMQQKLMKYNIDSDLETIDEWTMLTIKIDDYE